METDTSDAFFHYCVSEIDQEYKRLGHQLGWRFLGVPKRVLRSPTRIAFISLNPGGNFEPPQHPRASCEAGNWYTMESWANYAVGCSPLQEQVRHMFGAIADRGDFDGGGDELITRSLVANFIPFRSPSYSELANRAECLRFANRLWTKVLPSVEPTLIICLGRDTEAALVKLIPTALAAEHQLTAALGTGWGNYCATLHRYKSGGRGLTLLTLPHLSRFSLFTSRKCAASMQRVMDAACEELV